MKKMTMLQVARKFQENAIKATEHPILDKILAKNQINKEIENYQKDIKSGYLGEVEDDVLVYTTNQTNNRIREEWQKWAFTHKQHLGRMCDRKEIEDYWISKIDSLLKTQREELVERLSECAWCDLENGRGKYLLESDIKNLIKEQ